MTQALDDIAAERTRQQAAEGWTAEHDDAEHSQGALAAAASCYAIQASGLRYRIKRFSDGPHTYKIPANWPWHGDWWKPKNARWDLVRAGALIVAEIERLDRAAAKAERAE